MKEQRKFDFRGKMPCFKRVNKTVRHLDMHGVPITLLYKNKSTYRTTLGGYLSIIKIMLILAYISYALIDVFDKKSQFKTYSVKENIDGGAQTQYNVSNNDFDISIQMKGCFDLNSQPASCLQFFLPYVTVDVQQFVQKSWQVISAGNSSLPIQPSQLTFQKCNQTSFNGKLDEQNSTLLYDNDALCLNQPYYQFWGRNKKSYEVTLRITISRCNEKSTLKKKYFPDITCRNSIEIDNLLNYTQSYFILSLQTNTMNPQDFSEYPIKSAIFLGQQAGIGQVYYFKRETSLIEYQVKQRQSLLSDSMFGSIGFNQNNLTYYDTDLLSFDYSDVSTVTASRIVFRANDYVDYFEREVTTIWDAVAQIGGLIAVLEFIFQLFFSSIFRAIFYSKAISKLFLYQENQKSLTKMQAPQNKQSKQESSKNFIQASNFQKIDQSLNDNSIIPTNRMMLWNQNNTLVDSPNKQTPYTLTRIDMMSPMRKTKRELYKENIIAQITNRHYFKYSALKYLAIKARDFLKQMFSSFTKVKLHSKDKFQKQHLFIQCIKRLNYQLDIAQVIKCQRSIDAISNIVMTKDQKALVPYLKHNVINYFVKNQELIRQNTDKAASKTELAETLYHLMDQPKNRKSTKRLIQQILLDEDFQLKFRFKESIFKNSLIEENKNLQKSQNSHRNQSSFTQFDDFSNNTHLSSIKKKDEKVKSTKIMVNEVYTVKAHSPNTTAKRLKNKLPVLQQNDSSQNMIVKDSRYSEKCKVNQQW